ncbi:MAG: hypothetical protein PHD01_13415 [Geobacteraceae bacterium]|nr:hypothetical protein [Geobacteraceae bacterium]
MPRQARIDGVGALRHIICRGIERKKIFSEAPDRTTVRCSPATLFGWTKSG